MSLQLCVCDQVQVMKAAIPLKKIQEKTTLHARSVVLGMSIAQRSEFVVTGMTCGIASIIYSEQSEVLLELGWIPRFFLLMF